MITMKRFAFLAVAVGFSLFGYTTPAIGQERTGIKLLEECQLATKSTSDLTNSEMPKAVHCFGYLSGTSDTLVFWGEANRRSKGGTPPPACIPESATTGELARVVVKYLNDHPNRLHLNYGVLVILALEDAYPCK
jgi:Rap1a immunity proteins